MSEEIISLNDYLYSGNTVLKILHQYIDDLFENAKQTHNIVDVAHCNILIQLKEILEHNDFLTEQAHRIKELYMYMASEYPFLAFTFKGRIKSLIRVEEKINGYITEYIYDYYAKNKSFPTELEIKNSLNCFRDFIAYRIVVSLPKCHIKAGASKEEEELKYLYEIANMLPLFLEQQGFTVELAGITLEKESNRLNQNVRPYFRDYIENVKGYGYQSLHITFYDNMSRCFTEVQLRTKDMDDNAEIGDANHFGYEKRQDEDRAKRDMIPKGECKYFDDAIERLLKLQRLDLSKIDVNMFRAYDNYRINDGCGLFRGRQILPFEHLSRFQND